MTAVTDQRVETFADLYRRLGRVPLDRIRMDPPPGMATEADVIRLAEGPDKRLCELIDGVLVEKAMGARESRLAALLIGRLLAFVEPDDLGVVLGADGGLRMYRGNVRYPDVTFISWEAIGSDEEPGEAIWDVPPSLAIEVLSPSNTPEEIRLKLSELFATGCKLAWVISRDTQSAAVHTSMKKFKHVGPGDVLDGGKVLPGFRLPLAELFAATKRRKKGKPK